MGRSVTSPVLHVIQGLVPPAKLLHVHLLVDEDEWLWIDTGISSTPHDFLVPYVEALDAPVPPRQSALITHTDVDHFGGVTQLRARFPTLQALAHPEDARLIQDRAALMRERYLVHADAGIVPDQSRQDQLQARGGPAPVIDRQVDGGMRLGSSLEVLHLPGHSAGHLGAWDPERGRAFVGDAVLDWGLRDTSGVLTTAPPYYDVDAYLRSIALLLDRAPDELHTSHFPVLRGAEVSAFLVRSRACVEAIEESTVRALRRARSGATLEQLCSSVAEDLRCWPKGTELQLADAVSAHLERAIEEGSAHRISGQTIPRYAAA